MSYPLSQFSLSHMVSLGAALRTGAAEAASMEQAAKTVVDQLYNRLRDDEGEPACALVRLFTTLDLGELDEDLREFGETLMGAHTLEAQTKSLTLLATNGAEPAWRERTASRGHQTIPLPSPQVVDQIPMIAQLIRQFGMETSMVTKPSPELILELDQRQHNVFFVERAAGSPFIPAQQEFVARHGIQSVLGFGGMFPTGNVFAVLMFLRVPISREVANLFRPAALNVKLACLPFVYGPYFDPEAT